MSTINKINDIKTALVKIGYNNSPNHKSAVVKKIDFYNTSVIEFRGNNAVAAIDYNGVQEDIKSVDLNDDNLITLLNETLEYTVNKFKGSSYYRG